MFKKTLFHVLGVSMSLIVGLFAAEVIVRIRDEAGIKGAWNSFFGGEVPRSYDGQDQQIIADPVVGFRYNPDFPEANSLGIRNDEISLEKPAGRKRIIVLGDSVCIMWYGKYDPQNGFIPLLREELGDRAEIINAAVSGYTTYQQRLLLEHYLLPYKPDWVIIQYTLNDNRKFLHRWDGTAGMLLTEQARRAFLPEEGDPLAWLPEWSYLASRVRFAALQWRLKNEKWPWNQYTGFKSAWEDESWNFLEQQLVRIKQLVQEINSRIVIVMVPFGPQFKPHLLEENRSYVLKPQTEMAQICAKHDIPLIDLFNDFLQAGGSLFYDKVHLTAEGHQIVADALKQYLEGYLSKNERDSS